MIGDRTGNEPQRVKVGNFDQTGEIEQYVLPVADEIRFDQFQAKRLAKPSDHVVERHGTDRTRPVGGLHQIPGAGRMGGIRFDPAIDQCLDRIETVSGQHHRRPEPVVGERCGALRVEIAAGPGRTALSRAVGPVETERQG